VGTSSSTVGVGTLTIWMSFLRTTLLVTSSCLLPTTDYFYLLWPQAWEAMGMPERAAWFHDETEAR